MEANNLIDSLAGFVAPGRQFWEGELEIGCENVLRQALQDGFMDAWIDKRAGQQVEVLRRNLGLGAGGSTRGRKSDLRSRQRLLLPYLLVQEFAKFKSKGAIIDFARTVLSSDMLTACTKGNDDFDTLALCFAIYQHDPQALRPVLHFDKIHKSGFARMKLKEGPRKPTQPLGRFLQPVTVKRILDTFDSGNGDGRASEFKDVLPFEDHHFVFIRRCERPASILRGTELVHGYRVEWIVLDFFDGAKRVNISSLSVNDSLEIANRIASDYYGKDCEYQNESQITYAKQLDHFLRSLKNGNDSELTWVEMVVGNTPLDGSCGMKLTHDHSLSIGRGVVHFESAVGAILRPLDGIENIKVRYSKKRVSLQFEKVDGADDEFVVRYSDHRLSPIERRRFEDYMRTTYAIPILSTEKRFKTRPKTHSEVAPRWGGPQGPIG